MDEPELDGPKGFHSRFRAHQDVVGQTIGTGAYTPVRLDHKEYDTLNELSLATYRFTPRRAGWYYLVGAVTYTASVAGNIREVYIARNGVAPANMVASDTVYDTIADFHNPNTSTVVHLAKGDYAVLCAYQDTGGNLALNPFQDWCVYFAGHRLS